jgi:murein DD-endopeptidase MepM/ murein hydrolase activator NlpD
MSLVEERTSEVEPDSAPGPGDEAPAAGGSAQELVALLLALKVLGAAALGLLVALVLFAALFSISLAGAGASGAPACAASAAAAGAIPPDYLRLYQGAGQLYGLDWVMLAAIGSIESGHGVNVGPSSAGALGPMQFMPATWASYGIDGDGDGRKDALNPADAIPSAARLLRANGAPADWPRAIFAYNHAGWYVQDVLAQAERYRGACTAAAPVEGGGRLSWPVIGPVTSQFCERRPWERCHPGIDIAVPSGTEVHAAARGVVTLAQPVSGYGNFVCVTHGPKLTTCYAHLGAYRARMGAQVERGEVIALSDCTGRCFGAHLHFEVRSGPRFGAPVTDPLPYLGAPP